MSRSGPPAMASIAALFYTATAVALAGTAIAAPVDAQNTQAMVRSPAPNEARRRLFASHTSERIEVDGRLDEAAWRTASSGGDFVQHFPDVEKPASQRTEARVLVDGAAVYV